MVFCDHASSIVEWGSEEIHIPYRSPIDGKIHRYYPDFYIKVKSKDGKYEKYIIEDPKRKTAAWKREVLTYIKNRAKWEAAENFCEDRQMKFKILTEDHLKV